MIRCSTGEAPLGSSTEPMRADAHVHDSSCLVDTERGLASTELGHIAMEIRTLASEIATARNRGPTGETKYICAA